MWRSTKNCAGIAPAARTVGKEGAHALALLSKTITVNLIGSSNIIRLAATAMVKNEPEATGERDVLISTASVPFPSRLGTPQDYAKLVRDIIGDEMLNGEVIRLDRAIRLAPEVGTPVAGVESERSDRLH